MPLSRRTRAMSNRAATWTVSRHGRYPRPMRNGLELDRTDGPIHRGGRDADVFGRLFPHRGECPSTISRAQTVERLEDCKDQTTRRRVATMTMNGNPSLDQILESA